MKGIILALAAGILPMFLYAWFLYYLDRYEKEPLKLLAGMFSWGALIAAGAAFIINTISGIGILVLTQSDLATQLATATIIAPIVEETLKGIAVLLVFLLFKPEFDSPLDGIVFAGIAALGFAATENVWYIHQFGYRANGLQGIIDVTLVRVFLVGWQHPFYTSFIGLGFALSRQAKDSLRKYGYPLLGWSLAIVFHLLHNLIAVLTANLNWGGVFNIIWDWTGYLGLFCLILLLIKREQNWMKKYLAAEHENQTITASQYQAASSAWQQSMSLFKALFKGDYLILRQFYQSCANLMHKKRQFVRHGNEDGAAEEIQRLRTKIVELAAMIG